MEVDTWKSSEIKGMGNFIKSQGGEKNIKLQLWAQKASFNHFNKKKKYVP